MAEPQGSQAIVPVEGEYLLSAKEYTPDGKTLTISAALPQTANFEQWSMMQQIVMLKRGPWKAIGVPDIMWGLAYAQTIGADVMKGDLFPTGEGRWGTSNKYKIRKALETGKIRSIETNIRDTGEPFNEAKSVQKTDLECTVTIEVEGMTKPIVRRARLSRWYKANNPNWTGNPEHMLELNTVAHACEYIVPGGVEPDEYQEEPPSQLSQAQAVVKELKEAKNAEQQ